MHYCGSKNHTSGNCTNQPNNTREEPRSTPRDLHSLGPHFAASTKNSVVSQRKVCNSTNLRPANTENSGKYIPAGQQVHLNDPFPYKDYSYDQDRAGHQQIGFDKRYNRQCFPNYNCNHYQPSPLVSITGPDLSATLIDLANIQSRSLDLMVANQKSQQDAYNELTRANKDKANEAMFAAIDTYDGVDRSKFEEWINKLNQACQISGHDFRTEIIKKSIGAVQKVVLTSDDCSDDQLLSNLHCCFSDAPKMNQAREDLRNMRQRERESVMVYAYRWGRALVRSSGIHPEDERHTRIIKDFISSLQQQNIRNKITNKWTDLKNPLCTVQEEFDLAMKTETQI